MQHMPQMPQPLRMQHMQHLPQPPQTLQMRHGFNILNHCNPCDHCNHRYGCATDSTSLSIRTMLTSPTIITNRLHSSVRGLLINVDSIRSLSLRDPGTNPCMSGGCLSCSPWPTGHTDPLNAVETIEGACGS